ncbi:MAG: hypothetical protein L6Q37_04580 [Bdellovibrionaceae bacterium]|nr:hypothetical protein [Pseudobdellovibrionaceae bacterium]NUM57929.1 hypothetical protein [Pseudobdellovibrionaceae bacterium]
MKSFFLNVLLIVFMVIPTFAGGIASGGIPMYQFPVDIYFKCEAKLGIYIIDGPTKHYGVFKRAFELKAKKDSYSSFGVVQGYLQLNPEKWILEKETAENADMNLFQSILEARNEVSLSLKQAHSTSPNQEASLSVSLGLPDPDEVFSERTILLDDKSADISVYKKLRKDNYYSSQSLKVTCSK